MESQHKGMSMKQHIVEIKKTLNFDALYLTKVYAQNKTEAESIAEKQFEKILEDCDIDSSLLTVEYEIETLHEKHMNDDSRYDRVVWDGGHRCTETRSAEATKQGS